MIKEIMNKINSDNDDRTLLWSEHREKICSLIDTALKIKSSSYEKKIIIYGAGRCDDLNFTYLSDMFNEITLVDIDDKTVKDSVERLGDSIKEKINILSGYDFSGLDNMDYYNHFEALASEGNTKKIIKFIRNAALRLKPAQTDKQEYDVVLSTPVYTQLCFVPSLMILVPYVSKYGRDDIAAIKDELVYLTGMVIENYNRLLLSSAERSGAIVVVSDTLELSRSMPYMELLKGDKSSDKSVYDMLLSAGHGLVGAEKGMKDIVSKLKSDTVCSTEWIWNFSIGRKFYTRGITGLVK